MVRMLGTRGSGRLLSGAVWIAAAVAALHASQAVAQQATSGATHQVIGHGLTMVVDTRWVEGSGYRPVRFDFTPAVPGTEDRTLSITFSYDSLWQSNRYMSVTQEAVIPAGAATASATIAVPEHFNPQQYRVEVSEDGRRLKKLSFDAPGAGNWYSGMEEAVPGVLVVWPVGSPDTSVIAAQFPAVASIRNQWGGGPVQFGQLPLLATMPANRLPQTWLQYTNADLVFVPRDQLEIVRTQYPETLTAIRRWTAAGGNLIVTGAGANWEHLAAIEDLLELPALAGAEGDTRRGWTAPDKRLYGRGVPDASGQSYAPSPAIAVAKDGTPLATGPAPDQAGFVSRELGLGAVVAMAPDNPFPGAAPDWAWLLNDLGDERYLWFKRHGLSTKRDNQDFWNWMIQGVGLAPVTAFRVLISLFVLGIGPVNYIWLRYKRKLHLLLVIVPTCALSVTAGLFAWAMIGDGLGMRTRVRSYTEIDQRRGEAVCWSRISYYAGLAPLGGLSFAPDVAVYPLSDVGYNPQFSDARSVEWTDEGQRLTSGWVPARTVRQFVTVRARASESRLQISRTDAADPTVENLLGTHIERLIVVGPDGTAYQAADIDEGATAQLAAADAAALAALKVDINRRRPFVPAGMQPDDYYDTLFGGRVYYGYFNNGSIESPMQVTGRLEHGLTQVLSLRPEALPPRTYVALVDESPETDVGVESYRAEEDSLHVIVGRW
jgi:hypothetical protein